MLPCIHFIPHFHFLIIKKKKYYFSHFFCYASLKTREVNYANVLIMNVLQLRFLTVLFHVKPKDSQYSATAKGKQGTRNNKEYHANKFTQRTFKQSEHCSALISPKWPFCFVSENIIMHRFPITFTAHENHFLFF